MQPGLYNLHLSKQGGLILFLNHLRPRVKCLLLHLCFLFKQGLLWSHVFLHIFDDKIFQIEVDKEEILHMKLVIYAFVQA